jgi:hypothetical protein
MMSIKSLIVSLIIGLVVSLGSVGKLIHSRYKLEGLNKRLNKELMQANLDIGKAQTEFGNAQKYIDTLEQGIQDKIKENEATLTRIGWFKGQLKIAKKMLRNKNGRVITEVVEGPVIRIKEDCEPFVRGMVYEAITDKVLAPIEKLSTRFQDHRLDIITGIKPYPNPNRDIPFFLEYKLALRFRGELAETITPTGARNFYFNLYETDGKKDINKIKLTQFKVVITDERANMLMFAPRIDVGLTFGSTLAREFRYGGSFGLSFFGFGLKGSNLFWRFLRLSMDFQESVGWGCSPVLVNLGERLPLVTNIYLAPHIVYFMNRKWFGGIFMGAVL